MKLMNSLRNIALICAGTAAVLMHLPSDNEANAGAPHELRSTLATSPTLSTYLQARLQTAPADPALRVERRIPEPVQPPVVSSAAVVVAAVQTPSVDEYNTRSRTALNVREGPGTGHASLFVLQPDVPVRVEQVSGSWAMISTPDGSTGWAFASYLKRPNAQLPEGTSTQDTTATPKAAEPTRKVEMVAKKQAGASTATQAQAQAFRLANNTVMRSSPSTSSPRVSTVPAGAKLHVVERKGKWARVILGDGTSGWMNVR